MYHQLARLSLSCVLLRLPLHRADQEAARNRDANAAAIAALGGGNTSVQKRPWTETNPFEASAAAGLNAQVHPYMRSPSTFLFAC